VYPEQFKKICVAAGLVARESEGSYRYERRLDHDRADRQEPNLVFCLTVHEIPTLKAIDGSRVVPGHETAPAWGYRLRPSFIGCAWGRWHPVSYQVAPGGFVPGFVAELAGHGRHFLFGTQCLSEGVSCATSPLPFHQTDEVALSTGTPFARPNLGPSLYPKWALARAAAGPHKHPAGGRCHGRSVSIG
jgi:hypothetical protein